MESCIDAMSSEYDEFVAAAADLLNATQALSGGRPKNEALDKFKQRWQLLMASCDRAEEVVDSARRRIMAENVMDAASGVAPGELAAALTPSACVPRLEQGLHAVNSLAADLRHASTAAAVVSPPDAAGGSTSTHKAE